jgi:predicted naringenin-chalcone synthase
MEKIMYASILALATEVPNHFISQDSYTNAASRLLNLSDLQSARLKKITSGSQIQKRHTAVSDFSINGSDELFQPIDGNLFPKTGRRNNLYKESAPTLAKAACEKALNQWGGHRSDITHVISVSCTGMVAPGIEFLLIESLGLKSSVERLGINFMGCFGAFKGLAIAKALALENPIHRILLVCTELCSLHFQADLKIDTMIANSIFADGAAAVVIGCNPERNEQSLFEIHRQGSDSIQDTLELMTWEAGDYGYEMRLAASIPAHLEHHIAKFATRILGANFSFADCTWAVHPGGKSILEAISRACQLTSKQLSASWNVLRDYGNMSSPTFLFVLNEILRSNREDGHETLNKEWIIGLGFGPGLAVEGILLKQGNHNVAK